ncbi:MAG: SpoIIIAH-like family protein [Eubacteriales bacterium]
MRVLKRNQIMITALAMMIAVAGYLNFAGNKIGEEVLMTSDNSVMTDDEITALLDLSEEDIASDIESLDEELVVTDNYLSDDDVPAELVDAQIDTASATLEDEMANLSDELGDSTPGEAVFTSTQALSTIAGVKLLKEQTRVENKEIYLEIINNTNITETQKQDAIDGMIALTDIAEKEMAAEILLEAKGFSDVVVSISGDMVDVVVGVATLDEVQLAQIEDVIIRKTEVDPSNIIISPVQE